MGLTLLIAEINRWRTLDHEWSVNDCVTVAADWVCRVRGTDPAAAIRFSYASAAECQRVTGFFSDPVGVVGSYLAGAGVLPVDVANKGDLAVVIHRDRPCVAVYLGADLWASLSENAGVLVFKPRSVKQVWDVNYETS